MNTYTGKPVNKSYGGKPTYNRPHNPVPKSAPVVQKTAPQVQKVVAKVPQVTLAERLAPVWAWISPRLTSVRKSVSYFFWHGRQFRDSSWDEAFFGGLMISILALLWIVPPSAIFSMFVTLSLVLLHTLQMISVWEDKTLSQTVKRISSALLVVHVLAAMAAFFVVPQHVTAINAVVVGIPLLIVGFGFEYAKPAKEIEELCNDELWRTNPTKAIADWLQIRESDLTGWIQKISSLQKQLGEKNLITVSIVADEICNGVLVDVQSWAQLVVEFKHMESALKADLAKEKPAENKAPASTEPSLMDLLKAIMAHKNWTKGQPDGARSLNRIKDTWILKAAIAKLDAAAGPMTFEQLFLGSTVAANGKPNNVPEEATPEAILGYYGKGNHADENVDRLMREINRLADGLDLPVDEILKQAYKASDTWKKGTWNDFKTSLYDWGDSMLLPEEDEQVESKA